MSLPHRVLIDPAAIQTRVLELGAEISAAYPTNNGLVLVGILKGALYFLADLSRAITRSHEIDFIAVSSYTGTESSGTVTLLKDLDLEIHGRDVLIVEDIVDTGRTLKALRQRLHNRRPNSLRICTLLDKPARRKVPIQADYVGFSIADEFVIGYGLDFNQQYRNLPYIAVLEAS